MPTTLSKPIPFTTHPRYIIRRIDCYGEVAEYPAGETYWPALTKYDRWVENYSESGSTLILIIQDKIRGRVVIAETMLPVCV